ncbi:MAG: hypothetical protein CL607_16375, partial [Anaerolineaceae bacterium]|nr:hypothetical protein [Anaerolineaceae bacterium]
MLHYKHLSLVTMSSKVANQKGPDQALFDFLMYGKPPRYVVQSKAEISSKVSSTEWRISHEEIT